MIAALCNNESGKCCYGLKSFWYVLYKLRGGLRRGGRYSICRMVASAVGNIHIAMPLFVPRQRNEYLCRARIHQLDLSNNRIMSGDRKGFAAVSPNPSANPSGSGLDKRPLQLEVLSLSRLEINIWDKDELEQQIFRHAPQRGAQRSCRPMIASYRKLRVFSLPGE